MKLTDYLNGQPATLEQILDRRERRAAEQQALLQSGGRSLVSFGLNITGAYKRFPLAVMGFGEGLRQLSHQFGGTILKSSTVDEITGCEALLLLDQDPTEAKRICLRLEETHPLGRLFDFDVLSPDGEILSRQALGFSPRRCLLCGEDAKVCARSQAHDREALLVHTVLLLRGFFCDDAAEKIADLALRAALYEVAITPKPGLVDRANQGSHPDMNFFTFVDSAIALRPFFSRCYRIGFELGEAQPAVLFDALRQEGVAADRAMFSATGGVNTHQGLVFSGCILCGALGHATRQGAGLPRSADAVFSCCATLGQLSCHLFAPQMPKNGSFGARGEAASGFSTVRSIALPAIRRHLAADYPLNDAAALALIELISKTTDTNMIRRGGREKAEACRAECAALLQSVTPATLNQTLSALDRRYIQENLSPGGCADLLALGLLLHFLIEERELEECGG